MKCKRGPSSPPKQLALAIPKLSLADQDEADHLTAQVVYECGLSFTFFEHSTVLRLLRKLNPAYKPPKHYRLSEDLLNSVYASTKEKVNKIINAEDQLDVTFDETTNINNERVLNVAVTTTQDAFYYHNTILSSDTIDNERTIDLVVSLLKNVSQDRLDQINSVTTDTYVTIENI